MESEERQEAPQPGQLELFSVGPNLPEGLIYRPDFLAPEEEAELLAEIRGVVFSEIHMHGVIAKRRTAHFGLNYEYDSWKLTAGPEIPEFLKRLRERLPAVVAIDPAEFVEVLLTEYPAGAGIGWHRDAPAFGVVAGISLASACQMRFRRYPHETAQPGKKRDKPLSVLLEPRSAYVLQGPVRTEWQHSIPATESLRYSITYRTLRPKKGRGAALK